MACTGWNEQWVARLYGELEPEEERRMTEHLESCEDCLRAFEELEEARRLLGAASPSIPTSPRVVVLRSAGPRWFGWPFVAGLAAATLVFAMGLGLRDRVPARGVETPTSELSARLEASENERAALAARLETLEARLNRPAEQPSSKVGDAEQAVLTRADLDQGLDDLEQRMNYQRARDVEFLLGEMSAVEWRAGRWVDETRQAVRIALETNPGFSER